MDRTTAVTLTLIAGAAAAVQPPVTNLVSRDIGTWQSALVNFVVGAVAVSAAVLVFGGGFGSFRNTGSVPWYYLVLGGLCGAVIVTSLLVTVRTLGAGPVTAVIVAGQLGVSLVIDQYGWLGVDRRPLTLLKLVGVLLLAAGTYLIVRD